MCSSLARKGTLLIPTLIPVGTAPHLHFICNDPVFYPKNGKNCVLLVNISSIKNDIYHDSSCILNPGDHSFITKPSFVYYSKAEIYSVSGIMQEINQGNYVCKEDCNDQIFKRILDGFQLSEDVKMKIFKFYNSYVTG